VSGRLNWEHAARRESVQQPPPRKPIESTVPERPVTERQAAIIRELCDLTGATSPDLDTLSSRGAHWVIKNLQARLARR
jgi:hypothetical protein